MKFRPILISLCMLLLPWRCMAQDCFHYDAPVSLTGKLIEVDEAGYTGYTAIRPDHPVCTIATPNNPYSEAYAGLKALQIYAITPDEAYNEKLSARLQLLIGREVILKGTLWQAGTGYQRTNAVISALTVEPTDEAGKQALLVSKAPVKLRDVPSYDAVVHAGKRLVIEAYDTRSKAPLIPADRYLTHWMTGGEVVYFNCREGYELTRGTLNGENCFESGDPTSCGINAFPDKPLLVKLSCTRIENIKEK